MAKTLIILFLFVALMILCATLLGLVGWIYFLAASAFFWGAGFLSSPSFRSKLARVPAWKRNLVLMSVLFGAGLIWYAFFDAFSKGLK